MVLKYSYCTTQNPFKTNFYHILKLSTGAVDQTPRESNMNREVPHVGELLWRCQAYVSVPTGPAIRRSLEGCAYRVIITYLWFIQMNHLFHRAKSSKPSIDTFFLLKCIQGYCYSLMKSPPIWEADKPLLNLLWNCYQLPRPEIERKDKRVSEMTVQKT